MAGRKSNVAHLFESVTRDEALRIAAEIARGEMLVEKMSSNGDVYDMPPTHKERLDALKWLGTVEGWQRSSGSTKRVGKLGVYK